MLGAIAASFSFGGLERCSKSLRQEQRQSGIPPFCAENGETHPQTTRQCGEWASNACPKQLGKPGLGDMLAVRAGGRRTNMCFLILYLMQKRGSQSASWPDPPVSSAIPKARRRVAPRGRTRQHPAVADLSGPASRQLWRRAEKPLRPKGLVPL